MWKGWSENRSSVVGKIDAVVEMDEDAAVVVVAWSPSVGIVEELVVAVDKD